MMAIPLFLSLIKAMNFTQHKGMPYVQCASVTSSCSQCYIIKRERIDESMKE